MGWIITAWAGDIGGIPKKDICATSVLVAIWLIGLSCSGFSITSVLNCNIFRSFVASSKALSSCGSFVGKTLSVICV